MKHRGMNRFIAILLGAIFLLGAVPALTAAENAPASEAPASEAPALVEGSADPVPGGEQTPASPTDLSWFAGLTVEEQYAALLEMSEEEAEAAWAALSAEQAAALEAHIEKVTGASFETLLAKLMECKSEEEVNAFLEGLSEQDQKTLLENITEEQIIALAQQIGLTLEEEVITPPVDYSEVGPLMPAVTVPGVRLFRSFSRAGGATEQDALVLDKYAELAGGTTDSFNITLEAYTTGEVTSTTQAVPADIVLVLDESGSMKDAMQSYYEVYQLNTSSSYYVKSGDSFVQVNFCRGGLFGTHYDGWYTGGHFIWHWGTRYEPMTSATDTTPGHVQFYSRSATGTTKMAALKTAAEAFIEDVYSDAVSGKVDHRVSVISFSNNATTRIGIEADIRNNKEDVLSAIDSLPDTPEGGTYIEKGMANAKSAFDNAASTTATTRKRVVIVFTDGIPGSGTWNSTTISSSANPAIATAKTLKSDSYGATVYTIGMLDDANPELEISDQDDNAARTNKFLHYLSSNYPNAASMSSGGTGSNKGYYLSASDTESLNAIFEKIAQQIGAPSITLGQGTEIRDIVSPYFNMPADTSAVTVKQVPCTGYVNGEPTWGAGTVLTDAVTLDRENSTVKVTGFDFDKNFVAATGRQENNIAQPGDFYGRKLVITFTVTPKDGFLGGNGVPTNGATSGVYDKDGNVVENFDVPTVNVPIDKVEVKVAVDVEDINTYLLNTLTREQLIANATATCGEGENAVTLDLTKTNANYGLAEWQTEFVTISHALTHGADNTSVPEAGLTNLTADDTFKLTVTVAPTPGTEASEIGEQAREQSGSDTANIKVFKPELTFKDSTVYLGAAEPTDAEYAANNKAGETWKHGTVTDNAVTMTGEKPTLALTYAPDTNAIQNGKIAVETDIPVKVDVKIGETNVNEHTTFKHTACAAEQACTWATIGRDNGNPAFLLHVKSGTLTITKTGGASGESYVFTVTYTDPWSEQTKTVTLHEAVQGNGSKTIVGLPVGEYTVAEQTDWSWRYTNASYNPNNGSATLSAEQLEAEVTVTNSGRSGKWLSAEDSVINRWVNGVVNAIAAGASRGAN